MADFPKLPRLKADDENMERLHTAARRGETEECARLIAVGVDPNIANRFGCTALHLACKHGKVDTAKYLSGVCDGNQGAWHGQKPLQLAVLSNQCDLVRALVDGAKSKGRNVSSMLDDCDENEVTQIGEHYKHCRGQTALHWCVGLGAPYLDMLRLLCELGANPCTRDRDGQTSIMRALEFHEQAALEILLAVPHLRLEIADASGRGHLHYAIRHNNEPAAVRMLELGAPVDTEDEEHIVPFQLAIQAAMVSLTERLLSTCDTFTVQNCTLHNGHTVIPDRIKYFDFVANPDVEPPPPPADSPDSPKGVTLLSPSKTMSVDDRKRAVVQLLQRKLDEISAPPATDDDGTTTKKRKPSVKKMNLAPSAPVRSSSKARSSSVKATGARKSTVKK